MIMTAMCCDGGDDDDVGLNIYRIWHNGLQNRLCAGIHV